MQAATIHRYGDPDVFALEDLPTPKPRGKQLLVRVRYAGLNPVDWKMREGRNRAVLGPRWPKVLGHDFAGEVIATGSRARRFSVGDRVYGMQGLSMGAYATHLAVPEKIVAPSPPSLSLEEAAALPMTALTSLQALRNVARVQPGHRLLVNGASGGVGIAGVQLGKIFGAHVTAVCSARNEELVRSIGADAVINYHEEDFTQGKQTYDVVYDCVGTSSYKACKDVLEPRGVFVSVQTKPLKLITSAVHNRFRGKRDTQMILAIPSAKNLAWINEQVAAGYYRPVLDRRFSLEAIKDAHEYSQTGRARGKITIEMPA